MSKVLQLGFWLVLFAGLVTSMGFVEKKYKASVCDSLLVHVDYASGNFFISEEDVLGILHLQDDSLLGKILEEINIALLEESVTEHPSVKNAEVYSTINGELRISVSQKKPIARVISGSGSYYIDGEGERMELSKKHTARVPLVFGSLEEDRLTHLRVLLSFIEADMFWKAQVVEIRFTDKGITIRPRMGAEEIIIGDTSDLQKKFDKLNVFYKKVMPKRGLDYYSHLDVRFGDQVVCKKL